ncbi:LacI family DNA-binding transcriptional regulator [Actinomyces ruminis]|uniref:LacI family transcriptional regulator n=1 Tax=Actinomyces ruminis TaxID=1937003 RepID=A0ABX4M928_9ACTO|nr:LacI family DNA-binding transcriptional regulator [Actinomyces ruminis]PHP51957.1 LacI family transcriptional regulator [Actinomyces ruminis]
MARVTLSDIAKALGVSVSTVSLALRGSERISAPVREKVVKEAAAQGYRTDLAGALLRTTKPKLIGLVCDVGQELHIEYSREIITAAEKRGWLVMMEDTGVSGGAAAVSRITQLRARSLIIVDPSAIPANVLTGMDIPQVVIGQAAVTMKTDLVISNNLSGMLELAELLESEERVLCVDGGESVSSKKRRDAFLLAMRGKRARVTVVGGGPTADAGWRSIREVLSQGILKGGAIVCYNDQCALGALSALWHEHIAVPEDVRLVGFDNSRIARSQAFALTSIDRNTREVARLAVERAIRRADGDQSSPVTVSVDTRLVRRRTA